MHVVVEEQQQAIDGDENNVGSITFPGDEPCSSSGDLRFFSKHSSTFFRRVVFFLVKGLLSHPIDRGSTFSPVFVEKASLVSKCHVEGFLFQ
mmetsp:Transcript_41893/g.65536  ORF Transcript_41893/g.65536 Transcript_41893/m.65536 type:complete len:92 (+) Transcript_41893:211-486(+)